MSRVDVIVVGAGVAGSSVAYSLGQKGLHVELIESQMQVPETIKGELLQPGGVLSLQQMGLDACLEDIDAQPVYGFAVLDRNQERVLPYPARALPEHTEQALPKCQGYSFRHHLFVENLRRRACAQASVTLREGTVSELIIEDQRVAGIRYRTPDRAQHELRAPLTILASGRSPRIWEQLGQHQKPQKVARSVGVTLYDTPLPCPNHGHVFLVHPSPTLGYQIGSRTTRLLVDVPSHLNLHKREQLIDYLAHTIGPQLPDSLQGGLQTALAEGNFQSMQSLVMAPQTPTLDGVVTLGDALNMRHPLTGAGMTVALHDACLLTEFVSHENLYATGPGNAWIRQFYRKREPLAITVDTLSGALYQIFRAEQPGLVLMRDAVMRYWQLGGMAVSGPMSLLAGLNPNPFQLFLHYSAVALLGMGRPLLPGTTSAEPSLGRMKTSMQLGLAAVRTMAPHVRRGLQLLSL